MDFKKFAANLSKHVDQMSKNTTHLFEVDLDKQALWELYLSSFPAGSNEIFVKRTEHDCSCCRQFIKSFGNVVAIKNGKLVSIWDLHNAGEYQSVVDAVSRFVKSHPIKDIFVTDIKKFGTKLSRSTNESGKLLRWNHFHTELCSNLKIYPRGSIGTKRGELRDTRNVLMRSLEEITIDSTETLLELIGQKSLYKGEEWKAVLTQFLVLQKEYKDVTNKELYTWAKSIEVGPVIGRIRNHSIGTLLTNLSEGIELDKALKSYEKIVAPSNYKRPKAIFTKRMVADALKTVQELGLEDSLPRRYAVLDDIKVNNIIFANRDAKKIMQGDAFGELLAEASTGSPKSFGRLDEVPVDVFVRDVLPVAEEVEFYFENDHVKNMVSLIAPMNSDSKPFFKWDNGFSWAYSGNMTDSMKERVKAAGGNVTGVLRFSFQWNAGDDHNRDDFDAHCREPRGGQHIDFTSMRNLRTTGVLDVDITSPRRGVPAVENITWSNRSKMLPGKYEFWIHNYAHRGGRSGFTAEIEFDGQIYSFAYDKGLRQGENVKVAEVTKLDSGEFKIKELLPSNVSSREVWGVKTNQFHPVTVAMFSPNYWDDQDGIGHRHYFLMLDGCVNDEQPNGFFNEFLREEFMKHKRVFEALGTKMKVGESNNQLSGVGFSATKHGSFICKVKGKTNRTIKVVI